MKKYFLGLWISVLSFAQTDTTAVIQEIDFTEASEKCYQSYFQKLSDKNKLYPPKTAVFKGIYTRNGEDIPFSAEIEIDKKKLDKINFGKNFNDEENSVLREFFRSSLMNNESNHFVTTDKKFLKQMYCQYNEEEHFYTFRMLNNKFKQSMDLEKRFGLSFRVWLSSLGQIEKISFLANMKQDNQRFYSDERPQYFTPYRNGIKMKSVKGNNVRIKGEGNITFEINFD